MKLRHRTSLAFIVVTLLGIIAGGVYLQSGPAFYPYVLFRANETLQITFLQQPRPRQEECQATVARMVAALRSQCADCAILKSRCLEQLDTRQRKILSGQPVDVPVMRMRDGAAAFMGRSPGFALDVCKETQKQTGKRAPGVVCEEARAEELSVATVNALANGARLPEWFALTGLTILGAALSFLFCWLIVRFERLHARFSLDETWTGPQKFHAVATPRIGGAAIAIALGGSIIAIGAAEWLQQTTVYGLTMLALAAIPAFAGEFAEDVTKRVGVISRLMLTIVAGVLAALLVGATLDRLDVPGLDRFLHWPLFAIAFTAFAVGGTANAINIIDGYNGLVGGYAVLVLAALAWVAGQVGDPVVLTASLGMIGVLVGFMLWNYPRGRIFLGDGGAYLLGFWLAELSVLLVVRNPDVSPWFPLALMAYPVFETLFSIYRRTFLGGGSSGRPDALHLHQLIYKRLARAGVDTRNPKQITYQNSAVARYVWAGTALFMAPALPFWSNTFALMALALLFAIGYVWLYRRLVRWYPPSWPIDFRDRAPHLRATGHVPRSTRP